MNMLLAVLLLVALAAQPSWARTFVYVANDASGDIAVLELDAATGSLNLLGRTACGPSTMSLAVSPDRRFLHAAVRKAPFQLVTYAIDPSSGSLTEISRIPAPDNLTYIATDRTGEYLFGASYTGGTVAVMAVAADGGLEAEPVQVLATGEKPHAIVAGPSNQFVYVPHLGESRVDVFVFDGQSGWLSRAEPAHVSADEGSGPRHCVFSPDGRFLYVASEMDALVYVYAVSAGTGELTEIQRISALPADVAVNAPALADIHVTPDGEFLYASERATNTIAGYRIDTATGRLDSVGNFDTESWPRGFAIDPNGGFVLVAGQKSNHVAVHAIDPVTGMLTRLERYEVGNGPNWIEIAQLGE